MLCTVRASTFAACFVSSLIWCFKYTAVQAGSMYRLQDTDCIFFAAQPRLVYR